MTAELVLALPAVLLIMTLSVAAMSLQFTKLQLITSAATIASAVARGEADTVIDQLVLMAGEQVQFELVELEDSICVQLSVDQEIAGIELEFINLIETQCARAFGE